MHIFINFLRRMDQKLVWTTFRGLSNAQIMKSTILIPFLGYWIVFNQSLLPYFDLHGAFSDAFSNGFDTGKNIKIPTHILQAYFGLSLIALGSLLYQIRCPLEIKKYGSSTEYLLGEQDLLTEYQIAQIAEYIDENKHHYFDEEFDYMSANDRNLVSYDGKWPSMYDKIQNNKGAGLSLFYNMLNCDYTKTRWSLIILYTVGFYFFSIPSIKTFCEVFSLLFLK